MKVFGNKRNSFFVHFLNSLPILFMVTVIITTTIAFLFDHAHHKFPSKKTISRSVALAVKPTPTITPSLILSVSPTITPTILTPTAIPTNTPTMMTPTPTFASMNTQNNTSTQQETANNQTQPTQDTGGETPRNSSTILTSPLEMLTNHPLSISLGSL